MKILLPNSLFKVTNTGSIKLTTATEKTIKDHPEEIKQLFNKNSDSDYVVQVGINKFQDHQQQTLNFGKIYDFLKLSSGSLSFKTPTPLSIYSSNTITSCNNTITKLDIESSETMIQYQSLCGLYSLKSANIHNVKYMDAYVFSRCPNLENVKFINKSPDSKISFNRQDNPKAVFDISDYKNVEMELPFFSYSLYFLLPHKDAYNSFQFSPTEFNPKTCMRLLENILSSPTYKINTSSKFNLKVWFTQLNKYEQQDLTRAVKKWNGKSFAEILNVKPNQIINLDLKKLWVRVADKTNWNLKNKWTYVHTTIKEVLLNCLLNNNNKLPNFETITKLFNKYQNINKAR